VLVEREAIAFYKSERVMYVQNSREAVPKLPPF
jgi:hypothetical protein